MRTLTEPFWLIDNIDVHTWYYRDAPAVGSTVRYTNENFIDTVSRVTAVAIWFESGHMMRRPYLAGKLLTWLYTTLTSPRPRPRYARTESLGPTSRIAYSPQAAQPLLYLNV